MTLNKTQIKRRIYSVRIIHRIDEDPDTSWLGEYSQSRASEYSIDRAHAEDCPVNTPTPPAQVACRYCEHTLPDHDDESQECEGYEPLDTEEQCTCGTHGDMGRGEYRYFNPSNNYKGDSPEDIRKYTRQDYARMEGYNAGEWCFVGISAEAEVGVSTNGGESYLDSRITSSGLWGIESDSEGGYIEEIGNEQLAELKAQLEAHGFGRSIIARAFKSIETVKL